MSLKAGKLLILMAGIMELSWLYGWAAFSFPVVTQRPFPAAESIAAMFTAYMLTRLSSGRGWRIVWVILLQCAGYVFSLSVVFHSGFYASHPLLDGAWVRDLFLVTKDSFIYVSIAVHVIWVALFWWAGAGLALRPLSYASLCRRLDAGLAAFFSLFLFGLLMTVRGGDAHYMSAGVPLVVVFLLCGLTAIGITRSEDDARKTYLDGGMHTRIFTVSVGTVITTAGVSAMIFLSQGPLFSEAARKIFHNVGGFIGSVFAGAMRFFFKSRHVSRGTASNGQETMGPGISWTTGEGGWTESLGLVFAWSLATLCVLGFLFAVVYVLADIFRHMASKDVRPVRRGRRGVFHPLHFLVEYLRLFVDIADRMRRKNRGGTAGSFYAALLRWGRRSGMVRGAWETPCEFAARLKMHFPTLAHEIDTVVDGFNQEAYGEVLHERGQLDAFRSALRRMGNPRWWPLRAKSFFSCGGPV